ncbi:MAG: hypothetical protein E6Q97_14400 [Desulfurellales bacterium]|nr:MAG: hypothetical protein E6Q97_14400 [Desulfurellales bacterium]
MGVADPWTALQLDNAVALVGITLENASQELRNAGSEKQPKWEPKYTMNQLLDDDFRLPAPPKPKSGIEALKALVGVKVWKG